MQDCGAYANDDEWWTDEGELANVRELAEPLNPRNPPFLITV